MLCFSLVFFSFSSFSQNLSGEVVNQSEEGLPYVNVIVNNAEGNLVKSAVTDGEGKFRVNALSDGTYTVYLSLVGFEPFSQEVTMEGENKELGKLVLKEMTEELTDAVVIGEIPLIEVEPDRTVFNVEQNLSSSGNNALEVLRMAPGVQIDNENNIMVEGKAGVIVYIDDRQSYLSGEELEAFLLSLQADEIEKIEIITQPSSKYDAAGNAGIINIILKRQKGLGTNGFASATGTYGQYARGNSQVGFTTRTKKLTLSGNYSNYLGESLYFFDFLRFQNGKLFDSYTGTVNDDFNNNFRFNVDYDLAEKHTIGGGFRLNLTDQESLTNNDTPISDAASGIIDSTLIATTDAFKNSNNLYSNVYYNFKDTLGNNFTVDVNYGGFTQESENLLRNEYSLPSGQVIGLNATEQVTPIDIDIYVGQADYEKRLKKATLAVGAKYSLVSTDNDFNVFNVIDEQSIIDTNRTNQFVYDEAIYAGYLNYNRPLNDKWKFQGGLRYEYTDSKGDLTALSDQDTTVARTYGNWFPSGGLTYTPSYTSTWSLVYSRRIQRPSYQNLNPFEFQLNELSFMRGNPFLQPQYTDNIKITNTYKYVLTTSLSYSRVSDFFAQITEVLDEDRTFLQSRNVATQEVYNFSVSYPFSIKKKLNFYANLWANYSDFTGTDPSFINIDQFTYGGFAQGTWSISESVEFQLNGWYSSPSIWGGTYRTKSIGSMSSAIQKKWDRLTAKVSFNDMFYTQPWRADLEFPGLRTRGTGGSDSRTVQLYLSYNFGNKDVKSKKDRKNSAEDLEKRLN